MSRNQEVRIRFSKEEYDKVKRKSEELGMPVSSFIRLISLNSKFKVEKDY